MRNQVRQLHIFCCLHFVSECEVFLVKWLLLWKTVNVTCSLPLDFQTFLRFCYVRVVLTRYTTPLCPFFLKYCFTLSRNYDQVLGPNLLQSLIFDLVNQGASIFLLPIRETNVVILPSTATLSKRGLMASQAQNNVLVLRESQVD